MGALLTPPPTAGVDPVEATPPAVSTRWLGMLDLETTGVLTGGLTLASPTFGVA